MTVGFLYLLYPAEIGNSKSFVKLVNWMILTENLNCMLILNTFWALMFCLYAFVIYASSIFQGMYLTRLNASGLDKDTQFLLDTMLPNIAPETAAKASVTINGGYNPCQYKVNF